MGKLMPDMFLNLKQEACKLLELNVNKNSDPNFLSKLIEEFFVQYMQLEMKNSNSNYSMLTKEINQPLSVIGNYVHGCMIKLHKNSLEQEELSRIFKKILEQLTRASDMMLYSNQLHLNKNLNCVNLSIDSLIKETISFVNNYELNDFPLYIQYKPNKYFLNVFIDKPHIQQAILHVIRNALEAMKDANVTEPKLIIETTQVNKKFLEVSITDNGPGYDFDHYPHIFEPYFTTKSYGMGLGLSISRRIIEMHGGHLISDLNYPMGAEFKFTLPLNSGSV